MKKLGKKIQLVSETIEAYACGCPGCVSDCLSCGSHVLQSDNSYASSNNTTAWDVRDGNAT
jgi:putative bacteriocin precursor